MTEDNSFVSDLLDAMPSQHARMMAVAVLYRWQGQTIYLPTDSKASRRRRAASSMLANGMAKSEIVKALSERFNVTYRTAYRDCQNAMKDYLDKDHV